jgi:hypothetical protein
MLEEFVDNYIPFGFHLGRQRHILLAHVYTYSKSCQQLTRSTFTSLCQLARPYKTLLCFGSHMFWQELSVFPEEHELILGSNLYVVSILLMLAVECWTVTSLNHSEMSLHALVCVKPF